MIFLKAYAQNPGARITAAMIGNKLLPLASLIKTAVERSRRGKKDLADAQASSTAETTPVADDAVRWDFLEKIIAGG